MSDAPWPKGVRRIGSIVAREHGGRIYFTALRLNRSTGYEDPIELGAMTPEDFARFVESVNYTARLLRGEVTLIEQFGGKA